MEAQQAGKKVGIVLFRKINDKEEFALLQRDQYSFPIATKTNNEREITCVLNTIRTMIGMQLKEKMPGTAQIQIFWLKFTVQIQKSFKFETAIQVRQIFLLKKFLQFIVGVMELGRRKTRILHGIFRRYQFGSVDWSSNIPAVFCDGV